MTNPEADVEELLNAFLPFGQQQLEKKGEFFPYGGALKTDGELTAVAGCDGTDQPSSDEVIAQLKLKINNIDHLSYVIWKKNAAEFRPHYQRGRKLKINSNSVKSAYKS